MLKSNWGTICTLVEMEAADGKRRKIQASDTKGLLRIIQSIPSPKAEPFKLWLAQVGSDRLDEIENPELATQRTRELYKLKGHPDDWIEKRMRSIAIREELTEEWKNRGVKEQIEYSIPTAEISKATFDVDSEATSFFYSILAHGYARASMFFLSFSKLKSSWNYQIL